MLPQAIGASLTGTALVSQLRGPHLIGTFDTYLIGGGGYYRRTVEFTQPAITTVTAFDPFFGFYPANIDMPPALFSGVSPKTRAA